MKGFTKRKRAAVALTAAAAAVGVAGAQAAGINVVDVNPFGTNHVGTQADGRVLLPSNQYVTPAGQRITLTAEVTGSTVSPDGTHVAVQLGGSSSGAKNVDIIDASTGAVVQQFGGAGTSAPYYSPDGTALFATEARSILKYTVGSNGLVTDPTNPVTITMPNDGVFEPTNGAGQIDGGGVAAGSSLPLGITSSPDGSKLYVAENGSNAIDVIDTTPAAGSAPTTTTPVSANGTHAASDAINPLVSYNFNSDSGTTVTDSSGNSINGSWVGGPTGSATPTYQTGVDGQAARVGGNNIVQLPLIAGKTDASGSFSFEVWYYGFSQTGEASVFSNQNASSCSHPGFSVWMTSATDSALSECWPEAPGGPSVEYHDLGPATDNAWHYITVTVDRSTQTVKFYLDGQLLQTSAAGQMTASTVLTNVAWQLGWAPGDTSDGRLDGLVDDFNYYDQVIPSNQVTADYNATCGAVGCVTPPPQFTHTQIPVGNVPADVVVADGKAYVSNRGGAIAKPGQATNDSGGSAIIIDKKTNAAASGTVSVIDLSTNKVIKTIDVGLQPAAMTVHDGAVFVANTASDTVSVIDTRKDRVTQTVNVEPLPGSTVGAAPNAVTFAGDKMLVSVGRDNAIAQFAYRSPMYPIAYQGLIPTDGYPSSVAYDPKVNKVFVGNHEGISTDGAIQTYEDKGTVTDFTLPSYASLGTMTKQVFDDNGWNHLAPPSRRKDDHVAPVAIPLQLGQPSEIKHVILIDRENRTYDQILGDIGKGNSDPADANFGESVTPNAHAVSNQFTLFDNFYDNGMLSADGHNWLLQADNNDYLEQDSSTAWERSYPDLGGDELQNQTGGSIWNAAERAGLSVENFGEQQDYTTGKVGTFQQYYADSLIMEGKAGGPLQAPPLFDTEGDNASLNAITDHSYPGWNLNVPDQYRADVWGQVFKHQEATNSFPNLTILYLPNDHTGGNGSGQTSAAQVADNDLATGRVFDMVSHSKYWKSSAIFVVEDDSQAGNDHVDGHRAPLLIASPYVKHDAIDDSYYSQINVTKTIEQILGIQPMNQMDRAAVPMFGAFTNKPDLTPYNAVTPATPITQGVTNLISLPPAPSDSTATATSVSATSGPAAPAIPAAEQSMATRWAAWSKSQTADLKLPDMVNPAQMNRYDWYTSTDWSRTYPGDKSILAPDQVPGRDLPSDFLGGD
jgi:YVTN family beta-propeller protein